MLASLTTQDKDELGRDRFWEGDADDGVRRLAEELGWGEELEAMVTEGRERLEKEWKSEPSEGEDAAAEKAEKVGAEVQKEVGQVSESKSTAGETRQGTA